MKIKILLFATFITMLGYINPIYTQNENEEVFPTSDAIWVISVRGGYNIPGPDYNPLVYGLSGDTLINEKTYSKLYLLNDTTLNIDEGDIYIAGIRQADKKVFVLPAINNYGKQHDELLLYDFSKTEGDSITVERPSFYWHGRVYPTFLKSDSIYSQRVLIGYEYIDSTATWGNNRALRTVYDNRPFDDEPEYGAHETEYWIENVGSTSGLWFYPAALAVGRRYSVKNHEPFYSDEGGMLLCMKVKDEIRYKCPSCYRNCFYFAETSIEPNIDNPTFSIEYEKATQLIRIQTEVFPLSLSVIDLVGNAAMSSTISDLQTYINVASLKPGVYIYKISGRQTEQTGKIIIQ